LGVRVPLHPPLPLGARQHEIRGGQTRRIFIIVHFAKIEGFPMSVTSTNEGKKWIQASLALSCIFLGYVIISFFEKMAEWFLLESKIPYFIAISNVIGVVVGLATYVLVLRNPISSEFLKDVYQELIKVVWPDRNQTWKYTVLIMIGVTIMGFVFGFFDFGANFLLGLINK
jgi:preprotein translocase subunit SecE